MTVTDTGIWSKGSDTLEMIQFNVSRLTSPPIGYDIDGKSSSGRDGPLKATRVCRLCLWVRVTTGQRPFRSMLWSPLSRHKYLVDVILVPYEGLDHLDFRPGSLDGICTNILLIIVRKTSDSW